MPNDDNYRVNHGCWDCPNQEWGRDGVWCPYVSVDVWRQAGICDRHPLAGKEKKDD